jgi:hypothetical protein
LLQVAPVGVSSWQHVFPEGQVEVVENVGLGLQRMKEGSTGDAQQILKHQVIYNVPDAQKVAGGLLAQSSHHCTSCDKELFERCIKTPLE